MMVPADLIEHHASVINDASVHIEVSQYNGLVK